jgi:uncharacterized protein YndB with AHSA1/START domain
MSRFVYVTYIRADIRKIWDALREPEFTRQYWFGVTQECAWEKGADWQMHRADGTLCDRGRVEEIVPPYRLVLSWQHEWKPELKAEGTSRATYELEETGDAVKLTIVHEIDREGSQLIEAVSGGWPRVLSSLKSMLETGTPLMEIQPRG